VGASERAAVLHRLIADGKPYEKHLELAGQHSEKIRLQHLQNAKDYKGRLQDMQVRLGEKAQAERRSLQRSMSEYELKRKQRDDAVARELKATAQDFVAWKKDMESRVSGLPKVHGEPPAGESVERAEQRQQLPGQLAETSKRYFAQRRDMMQRLASQSASPPVVRKAAEDEATRKALGLAKISTQAQEYGAFLQEMHARHDERVQEARRSLAAQEKEARECARDGRSTLEARLAEEQRLAKEELAQVVARAHSRSRGYAGYHPVEKSYRRLREEEAERTLINGG